MPPSEPSPSDIEAVSNAIGVPAVVPETPVAEPVAQPAPATQPEPATDPFAAFGAPTEPTPVTAPTPPSEPTPQPSQPVEPQASAPQDNYQSYEDYMNEVLKDVPKSQDMPDPNAISPDDPEGLKKFFDDLVNTAVVKATSEISRKTALQSKERALWDEAFDKYGSLKTKPQLRDMVHNIRMGYFNRGVAITPKQAADKLLESLGNQYKQGVADNQVVTTIENVQPTGGGSGNQAPTSMDRNEMLTSLQTGGEAALAEMLDAQIKAGKL